jgi:5-methylcytosine-specific restriction protein A
VTCNTSLPVDQRQPRKRGRAGQVDRVRRLKRSKGLCEHCLKRGRTRIATRVDHTVPLALGGLDVDGNTRNLCTSCHAEATAEQFGHVVTVGERGVAANGRPTGADHPWNAARLGSKPIG